MKRSLGALLKLRIVASDDPTKASQSVINRSGSWATNAGTAYEQ